jgi:uncharacterized protein
VNLEESRSPDVPWGVADFVLVILAGLMGAFLAAAWVLLTEPPTDLALIGSTSAMSAGHLAGVAVVLRYRAASWETLGLDVRPADGAYLALGAALQIGISFVFAPLAERLDSDGTTQVVADQIGQLDRLWTKLAIVLLVALLAPVVEEVVFRGMLQRALSARMGPVGAVGITALVFSVFHWLGVDPSNVAAGVITVVQLFIVGVILGELTRRKGRLGPAILTHAGFNLIAVLALVFLPELA